MTPGRLALATALAAAVAGCRPHRPPAPAARPVAASTPVPATLPFALPPRSRLLVFAPHPDDEVLGAGGLLAHQAAAGQPARIVFFTNGDAYREAIAGTDGRQAPQRNDYLALGRRRQHEALTAARRLGLPASAVRFLGYPDDGLAALWQAHWTSPYTSPYTRERSARYPDVLLPGADYDGAELRWLVERVIARFHPTVIVFPHPADTHADHHHAGYFVLDAVRALQARERLSRRAILLAYVVHYPSWPVRRAPAKDRCLPDARIPDTVWANVELTARELETKREALEAHRTQVAVMGGFLHAFLCRNELFGILSDAAREQVARRNEP